MYGWIHYNPSKCGCNGLGWFLTDQDVWVRCPYHGKDAPHPEDEGVGDEACDEHLKQVFRNAFHFFKSCSRGDKGFNGACRKLLLDSGIKNPEPRNWVDAAEVLYQRAEEAQEAERLLQRHLAEWEASREEAREDECDLHLMRHLP